jgi:hypothetical protein
MHGAYTGAQFMTFKLFQKSMQNHYKNEDKNNIEKKRFPGSLPNERPGREVYPDIKGGTLLATTPVSFPVVNPSSNLLLFDANFGMIFVDILATF